MAKQILHIANTNALGGGIGTVLDYLNNELNDSIKYQSSVLKTNADVFGKEGYEVLERKNQYDEFIYHQNFLEQELAQYDVIHIHGIPSYRVLEVVDNLKRNGKCPKIVETCHSSVKKELDAHIEKYQGTEDAIVLENMIENDLKNDPSKFGDTYWGSAIHRQEKVMTLADKVQHMNNAYLDEIVEEYSAQENKGIHEVVYNGVEIMDENDLTEMPNDKRLLYSGRFSAEKGIDEFIESLPHIFAKNPDTKVKLMGGDKLGEVVSNYKQKTKDLFHYHFSSNDAEQYLSNIEFTGWISDKNQIEANYDWCDFLVMPSKDESFCLSIAEALNHGRIPIMTNTPSLNELYLSHGVGVGIDPDQRTADGIAKVINRALEPKNQPTLNFMAKEGRNLVSQEYSLEKVIEEQMDLYDSLF